MHILLTNDDGYFAPGLQTLYTTLAEEGYDVSIVAPDSQKSATGHSITLFEPLFITKYSLNNGIGYAVSGKPADCVKIAIQGNIIPKPDLVISGINNGPNLGTDVFYSGTVSAAMEGVLLGMPAIAVSLASFSATDYKPAAQFVAKWLQKLHLGPGLININIPPLPEKEWKGVRVTKLGKAVYENVFEHRQTPTGRDYYWQAGTVSPEVDQETDLYAVQEGYVSITPMHSDLTDYMKIKELRQSLSLGMNANK
ncbi:5'-nucleotidase [Desulfitobacterium dehalogenans ATCC 51507]|uniref:5'-nucleotidase SurE n=1 Tax=Desulfitobacterium dehalogenans (strain ATCC 51507 / DSM 9161 / JW/IU-DC1) TaxID=756499 RepID=I4A9Z5_DESDJ|nr:5'/3'-nucleotidase SurE [Desulfitobacterium dehalogenans]AFM00780.1 5'-nucleotidase [Desulfitobacterium dehalogenans ATCC 51507]